MLGKRMRAAVIVSMNSLKMQLQVPDHTNTLLRRQL